MDRARSAGADGEGDLAATELRLDSTLDGRRVDCRRTGLAAFLEAAFVFFAFKRMDLAGADAPRGVFFAALDLGFAFVAISPATYTDSAI